MDSQRGGTPDFLATLQGADKTFIKTFKSRVFLR
ncbi:hypothetical protein ABIE89_000609 [Bradyrhizobium niftali]